MYTITRSSDKQSYIVEHKHNGKIVLWSDTYIFANMYITQLCNMNNNLTQLEFNHTPDLNGKFIIDYHLSILFSKSVISYYNNGQVSPVIKTNEDCNEMLDFLNQCIDKKFKLHYNWIHRV